MTISRRQLGKYVASALGATLFTPRRAKAGVAYIKISSAQKLTSYGGGTGSLDPSAASLGDGSVRIGFTARTWGGWLKTITTDFTSTDAATGRPHTVGSGNFKSISSDKLRLPKPRIAVWSENADKQIWFQKLTAAGAPANSRISIRSEKWAIADLRAIALSDGRILVVWLDVLLGHFFGQILTADGAKVGNSFNAAPGVDISATNVRAISLCALPNGGFATAYRNDHTGLVQRFTAAGARNGAAVILEAPTVSAGLPGLACFSNGDLLAVYGIGKRLRARRLVASGGKAIYFEFDAGGVVGGKAPGDYAPQPVFAERGEVVVIIQYPGSKTSQPVVGVVAYDTWAMYIGYDALYVSPYMGGAGRINARVDSAVALPGSELVVCYTDGDDYVGYASYFQRLAISY